MGFHVAVQRETFSSRRAALTEASRTAITGRQRANMQLAALPRALLLVP